MVFSLPAVESGATAFRCSATNWMRGTSILIVALQAVRPMRPSMVWTPAPRRYGTPQRTHLRGLTPAMSRKHRCLTGLI